VVGPREEVARSSFRACDASWVGAAPERGASCEVQIRHRGRPLRARIEPDGDSVRVTLREPAVGVAPGQSAVFYRGDTVLGGGRIG
jgi:tRNA-specific 2-thiouridylase